MATLPTIPASYTELTENNYRRGVAVLEAGLQSIMEGENFAVSQRTKVAVRKSWMQYTNTGTPTLSGTSYDASTPGYVTSIARYTPSRRVTRLIWQTRCDDGTLTLEIATDYAFSDSRSYDNAHPAGGDSLRSRTIAVAPLTPYYMRIRAADGAGRIELWSANVYEDELNESDLAMHVPEYATITLANSDLSPTGGEICTVNGHLMYFRNSDDLEYPGNNDNPDGVWVPYEYRDSIVRGVIDGAVAVGVSPHDDWGWAETTAGAGTVTPNAGGGGSEILTFDGAAGGNEAYWDLASVPTVAGRGFCVYAELYITSQTGSLGWAIEIDDNVYKQRVAASGVTDSRMSVNGEASFFATPGVDTALKVLLVSDEGVTAGTSLYDYDTMDLISAELRSTLGAGASLHSRIGAWLLNAGVMSVQGFPALAIFEKPA